MRGNSEKYGRVVLQAVSPDTLLSIEELLTEALPGQASGDHQPALGAKT
jgi:hypothetical protein